MIDRAYTKAEARYIPNGADSTADMAHPTRTGDLVVFSAPPYQFDAATPGTLIARSAFFGQHGYVPDVQDLETNTNMRATFLAGGPAIRARRRRATCAASTSRRRRRSCSTSRRRSTARASCGATSLARRPALHAGLDRRAERLPRPARSDDDDDRRTRASRSAGRRQLATLFDEEAAALPGRTLLLAAGDNVGASPPNSALLEDRPTIDVENAWGLDATSFGNHEFDFGLERILAHQARSDFPFLSANIVEEATGEAPDWIQPSAVFRVNGVRVGVIGATVRTTPELVRAGNTAGLRVPRRGRADPARVARAAEARREGAGRRHPRGRDRRRQRRRRPARGPWQGPIMAHRGGAPGHDGRPRDRGPHPPLANTVIAGIPVVEGVQRGRQLLGRAADGAATATSPGPARRRAWPRTSASPRAPTSRRSSTRRTPRRRCCATR